MYNRHIHSNASHISYYIVKDFTKLQGNIKSRENVDGFQTLYSGFVYGF